MNSLTALVIIIALCAFIFAALAFENEKLRDWWLRECQANQKLRREIDRLRALLELNGIRAGTSEE